MEWIKDWNLIGKLKGIVIAAFFIMILLGPHDIQPLRIDDILAPLIGLCLVTPVAMKGYKFLMGMEISKPSWNDNPFNVKKPMIFFQLAAYFFLACGVAAFIGALIKVHAINGFALSAISGGVGLLLGMRLTLKWIKP